MPCALGHTLQQRDLMLTPSSSISFSEGALPRSTLVLRSLAHFLVVRSSLNSYSSLAYHIICMYTSHGMLEEARRVLSKVALPHRHIWASIIVVHGRCGQPMQAIELYAHGCGSWNCSQTNMSLWADLKACATAHNLSSGRKTHADILGTADKPDMFVNPGRYVCVKVRAECLTMVCQQEMWKLGMQ